MIGVRCEPLPQHKQELIDWLREFRHTGHLVDMIVRFEMSPEQTAKWREQFEGWLVPKSNRRESHARSLG